MARKFRFVEDFVNPETGKPVETDEASPTQCSPANFPKFTGHVIARVVYDEREVERNGVKEKIVVEKMGERGGYVENASNLSQDGECWVKPGGYVCGSACVRGDAEVRDGAEIGENAVVDGKATVGSGVGIGGSAYVYGSASVTGSGRLAVKGNARVGGKVQGNAVVDEFAEVRPEGTAGGYAVVRGNAVVYGKVEGNAVVEGNATVYGRVCDDASAAGCAVVLPGGEVKDKARVESGLFGGTAKDAAVVSGGQPNVWAGAELSKDTQVGGNVSVRGKMERSTADGNASVEAGATAKEVSAGGNSTLAGKAEKAAVSGCAFVAGKVEAKASAGDGARIGSEGKVSGSGGKVGGSANVLGSLSASASGNAVVCGGSECGKSVSGNEVFVEDGDGEPAGFAVVCKVE